MLQRNYAISEVFSLFYYDIDVSEKSHLCKILVKKETVMLNIVMTLVKISIPFPIRLDSDSKLQRQRTTKSPIKHEKKVNVFWGDL